MSEKKSYKIDYDDDNKEEEYDDDFDDYEEDDTSIPEVYSMSELIRNGVVKKTVVTFDTDSPPISSEIHMYEYAPELYSTFALRKSQEDTERAFEVKFGKNRSVIFYLGSEPLTEELKRTLRTENQIKIYSEKKLPYDLSAAHNEINRLNDILRCRDFRLSISYIYDLRNDQTVYSYEFKAGDIIICLFQRDTCVSSIILVPTITNSASYITIESRTKPENEGNNLNKLLRAAAIIVAPKISSNFVYLTSVAINPISVYLMLKYFHGEITTSGSICDETQLTKINRNISSSSINGNENFTMKQANEIINKCLIVTILVTLSREMDAIANRVFEDTAAIVRCDRTAKGGKRRLNKSTRRKSIKTKRRVKGRPSKRQTKRRQRK
jgi:hypothetical protein